jgi:hypothetical protein
MYLKKHYFMAIVSIFIIYIMHKPILESLIVSKFYNKFAKDISIRNLSFENGFVSFDIFIEEKRGVEFSGEIDFFNLEMNLKYRILKGDWNWFKKEIISNKSFSANGNIFFSFNDFKITGDLKSGKERLIFKYIKSGESIESEIFLKDFRVHTLRKLFDLKLFGDTIDINATFAGNERELKSENSLFKIDGNSFNGMLYYLHSSVVFSGISDIFNRKTEFTIGPNENILNFEKFPISLALQRIFNEKIFYGLGNISVSEIDKQHFKFTGIYENIAIEDRKIIRFMNSIFDFGIYDIPLKNVEFEGELKEDNFIFSMAGVTNKVFFKIENASINLKDNSGTIPFRISSDEQIGEFVIDLKTETIFSQLSDSGSEKFQKEFIQKQEDTTIRELFR